MFLFAILLLTALFSSYGSEAINTEAQQPYTAQQHFVDVIKLLDKLEYQPHEIGIFSFQERKINNKLQVTKKFLEERLTKESNDSFLLNTLPFLHILMQEKEFLVVAPHKALGFYCSFIDILKKRDAQLDFLTEEQKNLLKKIWGG